MNFRGKLLKDGAVLLDGVTGSYQVHTSPTGVTSWSGSFSGFVQTGAACELVLDDGRSGTIGITGGNYGSGRVGTTRFKGNGHPP